MAEQQLPVWNSKGVEPPANLQREGWQPGVKPPAQYFDWLFNRAYECLEELQAITEALETNKANGTDLTTLNNKVTKHLDESKVGAHKAKNIALDDVDGLFVGSELETAMKELFTNVSNGKGLIGTSITDVDPSKIVPNNPTFQQLADLIKSIRVGKRSASGTVEPSTAPGLVVNGLAFRPSIMLAKRRGYEANYNMWSVIHAEFGVFKISYAMGLAGNPIGNNSNTVIRNDGFTIKGIEFGGWTYDWFAIE